MVRSYGNGRKIQLKNICTMGWDNDIAILKFGRVYLFNYMINLILELYLNLGSMFNVFEFLE